MRSSSLIILYHIISSFDTTRIALTLTQANMASSTLHRDRPQQPGKEPTNFLSLPRETRQQTILDIIWGAIRLHSTLQHGFEADPDEATACLYLGQVYWVDTTPADVSIVLLARNRPRLEGDLSCVEEHCKNGICAGGFEEGEVKLLLYRDRW